MFSPVACEVRADTSAHRRQAIMLAGHQFAACLEAGPAGKQRPREKQARRAAAYPASCGRFEKDFLAPLQCPADNNAFFKRFLVGFS
jgi:hypothetical protein